MATKQVKVFKPKVTAIGDMRLPVEFGRRRINFTIRTDCTVDELLVDLQYMVNQVEMIREGK